MKGIEKGFEKVVGDPALLDKLKETAGGKKDYPLAPEGMRVFWNTLYSHNGWKLQKNYYYDHYRILDEYNTKRAWGAENAMISALEAL